MLRKDSDQKHRNRNRHRTPAPGEVAQRNWGLHSAQAARNSWRATHRQDVFAPRAKHQDSPCSPKPAAKYQRKVSQLHQRRGSRARSREQYLPQQEREETAQRYSNPKASERASAPTAMLWAKLRNTDSAMRSVRLG